ncbi:ankyrin repeat domain-containing protein [Wolbachia pipientis]|uniref:ankyrin repeat domain-containing protein n=2 Tax=Wolbachia pipientis TaxID=955 RepID=UPI0038B5756D
MTSDQLLAEVLSIINDKTDLNEDNIIQEIEEELKKQNQDLHEEWKKVEFHVNHLFSQELTLLHVAARGGFENVAKVLVAGGADVNKKDSKREKIPLHLAARNGHASVVEVLLEKGAHVNAVNSERRTPLHLAAGNGHVDIVNLLLEKGANVNAVDRYGKTPLDYAEGYAKNQDVVKALLDARGGSFVKARNKAMIAGGVNTLLGTAIAVALFTTGTITAQLIPIVIAVVAVTAAALVVGCATYELLKPSTKVDGAEKPIVNSINEHQGVTSISSY